MRLCSDEERASVRDRAADAARALESTTSPIGRMQRAFYFQIIGGEAAELQEWRKTVQEGEGGLFASHYATVMLSRNRSAKALDVLDQLGLSANALGAVSRAFLLLDKTLPEEAQKLYHRAAAGEGPSKAVAGIILLPERCANDLETYIGSKSG